jgi:hypothetical protein
LLSLTFCLVLPSRFQELSYERIRTGANACALASLRGEPSPDGSGVRSFYALDAPESRTSAFVTPAASSLRQ